jgi:hypothetical protein
MVANRIAANSLHGFIALLLCLKLGCLYQDHEMRHGARRAASKYRLASASFTKSSLAGSQRNGRFNR